MSLPIDLGTSEIVNADNTTLGYVFVEDSSDSSAQQIQRWVLYSGFVSPPTGSFRLRNPADSARRYTSFSSWSDALKNGDLFPSGARYVKTNCVSYDAIAYVPPYPEDEQFDFFTSKLTQGSSTIGFVFTVGSGSHTYEHWVVFDGYTPPPRDVVIAGAPGSGEADPSLTDFLRRMGDAWSTGSAYIVCANVSHTSLPGDL